MGTRRLLACLLVLGAALLTAPASSSTAALVLTPSSGPAPATTSVTGTGFPASTKGMVTVARTRTSVRTDARGAFTVSVGIPAAPAGSSVGVRADVGTGSATASYAVSPTAPPPPGPAKRMAFGVSTPGGLWGGAELDEVTALVGEAPSVVLVFADLTRSPDVAGLQQVAARGAVPMVTLEPWVAGQGVTQPDHQLRDITAGQHDHRLREWAAALGRHEGTVYLRFAHEMNGDWYPWAEKVNGNSPGDYVAAWRHVRGLFAGATNVRMVWAPNVPFAGSTPLAGLFPGTDAVDAVGLDGYNWGTTQRWSSWVQPEALFRDGIDQVRALAPTAPLWVTETASAERGGSKADWNSRLVPFLDQQLVDGFVWFHHRKETDWRIDSSTSSASALKAALAARAAP